MSFEARAGRARDGGLTILIPLHKASAWIENVSEIIHNSPRSAKIILSDQSLADDALFELQSRHSIDSRVTFLQEPGKVGWREHANYLIKKVSTEFFSIMPQDDSFSPGYYESLWRALKGNPKAGISFGPLEAYGIPGKDECVRFASLPDGDFDNPWQRALDLLFHWNFGIAYRGVIRSSIARPILPTPGDRFADLIWTFGLALKMGLVEVDDAIYKKRYYEESTHATWRELSPMERNAALLQEVKRTFSYRPLLRRRVIRALRKRIESEDT